MHEELGLGCSKNSTSIVLSLMFKFDLHEN